MPYYTGVGSRYDVPDRIFEEIVELASWLEKQNYILRTGDAVGVDSIFALGVKNESNKCVFTPKDATYEAELIAARFHPKFKQLSRAAQLLHSRNVFQVLGKELNNPSEFLVCWTKDGACKENWPSRKTGGTGQALRIAFGYGVPVFNLSVNGHLQNLKDFINRKQFFA